MRRFFRLCIVSFLTIFVSSAIQFIIAYRYLTDDVLTEPQKNELTKYILSDILIIYAILPAISAVFISFILVKYFLSCGKNS